LAIDEENHVNLEKAVTLVDIVQEADDRGKCGAMLGVKEGKTTCSDIEIKKFLCTKDVHNSGYKNKSKNKMFIFPSHCTVEDSLM
jgi:hypothetical protein